MKKRLNLVELELRLPAIDEKNSKILLGGSNYDGGFDDTDNCGRYCCDLVQPTGSTGNNHNDYGDNFDQDVSNDGYYQGYDQHDEDGTGTNGTGTNTATTLTLPENLTDGLSLSPTGNVIMDLSSGNAPFNSQLSGILQSNSVIAGLINTASQGEYSVFVQIGNIFDPTTLGTTVSSLNASQMQTIIIDSQVVTAAGMADIEITDNTNFNHDPLNAMESLVAIMAHEAFHAYSNYGYTQAVLNGANPLEQQNWMLSNGYSQDVVNIWFTTASDGTVTANDLNTVAQIEHDYMQSSSFTLVNDAIAEYNADRLQAQALQDSLESMIQQAASNLGSGVDADGGQGPGPTNADLQNIYDDLMNQLEGFLHEYGWLVN